MMVRKDLIVAVLATFCLTVIMFTVIPVGSIGGSRYDPWLDYNDDGKIDVRDIAPPCAAYGSTGTPLEKASMQYDSGWINITDKCGQNITITHNMNSSNIIVDITGKTTIGGIVHQRHLVHDEYGGKTGNIPGWNKAYGGSEDNRAYSVIQTSDGGYAIAGYTNNGWLRAKDFHLIKTDATGDVEWWNTYGGTLDEIAHSVIQTTDGGYALAGCTNSIGAGGYDFYLVKTNSEGVKQWEKTFGGTSDDEAYSVVQSSDGGYVLAGYTASMGAGGHDFYLVKTDSAGIRQWDLPYGGPLDDEARSLVRTSDGGYALAGHTHSYGAGSCNFYLVKTNAGGTMLWNQTYGGTYLDIAFSLIQTTDGGYALAGWTGSSSQGFGLIKTYSNGTQQWVKTFGGWSDYPYSVVQTMEGGYALAGSTGSPEDFLLIMTDPDGNMQWNKTYDGANEDWAYSVIQTSDGGFALAGSTGSLYGGSADFWLVKTVVELGLAWIDSTANSTTLYRGITDQYWNFVRVRLWKPR